MKELTDNLDAGQRYQILMLLCGISMGFAMFAPGLSSWVAGLILGVVMLVLMLIGPPPEVTDE